MDQVRWIDKSQELKGLLGKMVGKKDTGALPEPGLKERLEQALIEGGKHGCLFGFLVEQRLKNMEEELKEMKLRINGLIFLLSGAVALEVIFRLIKGW